MCIIINKPVGAVIPRSHIEESYRSGNSDGIGVSRIRDGQIKVTKLLDLEVFLRTFGNIIADPNENIVVHMRLATHGSVKVDNCHPFKTAHGGVIHHNGIISSVYTQGDETDTEAFIRTIFNNTPDIEGLHGKSFIEDSLTRYNKFVYHSPDNTIIYNEKSGHWNIETGCWYSNYGYEKGLDRWGYSSYDYAYKWYDNTSSKIVPTDTVDAYHDDAAAYYKDGFAQSYWFVADNLPDSDAYPDVKPHILKAIDHYRDMVLGDPFTGEETAVYDADGDVVENPSLEQINDTLGQLNAEKAESELLHD